VFRAQPTYIPRDCWDTHYSTTSASSTATSPHTKLSLLRHSNRSTVLLVCEQRTLHQQQRTAKVQECRVHSLEEQKGHTSTPQPMIGESGKWQRITRTCPVIRRRNRVSKESVRGAIEKQFQTLHVHVWRWIQSHKTLHVQRHVPLPLPRITLCPQPHFPKHSHTKHV
jgi:hypothetical protein